jgi:hypothetical protein
MWDDREGYVIYAEWSDLAGNTWIQRWERRDTPADDGLDFEAVVDEFLEQETANDQSGRRLKRIEISRLATVVVQEVEPILTPGYRRKRDAAHTTPPA